MTTKADEMKERKALAGSNSAMTFHSRALADLQLEQGQNGRFTDKAMVSGSEPAVRYPAAASWVGADAAPEPPLGFSINDMEVVGQPHEVAQAAQLAEEIETSSPSTASALVALPAAPPSAPSPSDDVERGSATTPTALATSSSPEPASVSSLPLVGNDVAIQLAEVLPKLVKRRKVTR